MEKDKNVIFNRIKNMLKNYENPLTPIKDTDDRYELSSIKEMVVLGRKKKDIYFAGTIIQKNFVGFYFMPVYIETELKNVFKPELLKLLKGKSCFHIKALDDVIEKQIEEALEIGYNLYKERGWI